MLKVTVEGTYESSNSLSFLIHKNGTLILFNLISSKWYAVSSNTFHLVSLYINIYFELGSKEQLFE